MYSKNLFLSLFFFLFCIGDAFNITKFLNQYADFSTFNDYLTQTQLAAEVNSRQTITVLVVGNGGMGSLSGFSADVLKDIMSVHVVLDYYDIPKLQNLARKSIILTTLFQTTGMARNQQGFINATALGGGGVSFGSAANPGDRSSSLVTSVAQQAYNFSVLQISNPIIPNGISNSSTKTASPPPKSAPPAPAPASSPTPAPSKAPPSPAPKRSPPKRSPVASPPKGGKAPVASPPKPDAPTADTPTADTPAADAPAAEAPAADTPPRRSFGTNLRLSIGAIFMVVSSALWTAAMI